MLLGKEEILESLGWLSDWLQQKHPGKRFELVLVGGAALALHGLKDQTVDIDLFSPDPLPEWGRSHRSGSKARARVD